MLTIVTFRVREMRWDERGAGQTGQEGRKEGGQSVYEMNGPCPGVFFNRCMGKKGRRVEGVSTCEEGKVR